MPKGADAADCTVSDRRSETITLGPESVNGKDVLISRLMGCRIEILGSAATLHATLLEGCTLLAGPVASSVFVDDCADCQLALGGCQQLRAHRTSRSDVYLRVTSGAIVEDCKEVRFAPEALDYPGLSGDLLASALDPSATNKWDQVQDFNWLASDKPSPNWSVLPAEERKAFKM